MDAALGSSRKRSSGMRQAPCAATMAAPTSSPEMMSEATVLRKKASTDATTRPSSVSRSVKERPKSTTGWSEGWKAYRKHQAARTPRRARRAKGCARS